MIATYPAAPDIDVLTSTFPIPGFGFVPVFRASAGGDDWPWIISPHDAEPVVEPVAHGRVVQGRLLVGGRRWFGKTRGRQTRGSSAG